MSSRSLDPQGWAERDKRRLERRTNELEAALAREHGRRQHATRVLHALQCLEDGNSQPGVCNGGGSSTGSCLTSYSFYQLKPHEEQLLLQVLARDEALLDDPFDASTVCTNDVKDDADSLGDCMYGRTQAGGGGHLDEIGSSAGGDALGQSLRPSTPGSMCSGATGKSMHSQLDSSSARSYRTLADVDAALRKLQSERNNSGDLEPSSVCKFAGHDGDGASRYTQR